MSLLIQNFILFQLGWLACVLTGAGMLPAYLAYTSVFLIIALHLARADDASSEVVLLVLALVIGMLWENSLLLTGLFTYTGGHATDTFPPLWLLALWPLFATLLNVSMKWIKGRYWLASIAGFIGGPLAFYSGHRLGAVNFTDTSSALIILGAGWAVLMPLMVVLATRFNGYYSIRTRLQEAEAL